MGSIPTPAPRAQAQKSQNLYKGGISTGAVTAASLLTEAGTVITSGIGIVWSIITANPILTLFVGASIVTLGFKFFSKAKGAAKK